MRPARLLWVALGGIALVGIALALVLVLPIIRPRAEDGATPPDGPHPVSEAEALYEEAIGDLETAFRSPDAPEGLSELHAAMEPDVQALDAAIAESRRLAAEAPDDEQAQETLIESLRRKLDLFHNTLMLMRDMERGDSATAQDRIDAISGRERPDTG